MKQIIEAIATYSRLDLSDFVLAEIAEETQDFDLQAFHKFIKNSLDRAELQFVPKGMERFLTFCKMYRKEMNIGREEKAISYASKLCNKVRKVCSKVLLEVQQGNPIAYKHLQADNKPYFTAREISDLSKVGNLQKVAEYEDALVLEEKLQQSFINSINAKQVIALPNQAPKLTVNRF